MLLLERYEMISLRAQVGMFKSESRVIKIMGDILLNPFEKSIRVASTAEASLALLSSFSALEKKTVRPRV